MNQPKILRSIALNYFPKYAMPEQVMSIAANARQMVLGHIAATCFVLTVSHSSKSFLAAVPWAFLMLLSIIPTITLFKQLGENAENNTAEVAAKISVIAALRGLLWLVGMISIMPAAGIRVESQLELVMLLMLIAGVVTYWSLPLAALSYSTAMLIGAIVAIYETKGLQGGLGASAVVFVAYIFFNRTALWHAKDLRARVLAVKRLKDEQEVVSLLLREFEEDARDWLWKTDSNGILTRGADGFSDALNLDLETLLSKPLLHVVHDFARSDDQVDAARALAFRLGGDGHFTDCEISCGEGEATVYLNLTAKPDFNEYGQKIGWHGVCANISEARKAEANVQRLASIDTLTGLPNRARLRETLEKLLNQQDGVTRHVAYADLDGFKNVNDMMGHAAGDAVLRTLACRFATLLNSKELVARIGGDEFVFVLERSEAEIETAWREIVKQASEPIVVAGQPQCVGISLGIVELDFEMGHVDEVLRRADLALYKAKNQGRGTARHYTKEMDDVLAERRELEAALRLAVSNQSFELHYQPIFACHSGNLCGYEALIRWRDPKQGLISPAVFIPLAEECGLIGDIGAWVLHQACKDARSFAHGLTVAVNISANQMRSRRLLVDVTQALAASGLPPYLLELEMTETALADTSGLPETLTADLKALGVLLALDDFGTGYSSLSYLHRFKFDRIKIDRSFVQAYDTREVSRAVVDAILALAQQLKISVTAEGIETEAQYRLMAEKGIDCAQGFLLGKPQPLAKILELSALKLGVA